jgi:hypothetical protein
VPVKPRLLSLPGFDVFLSALEDLGYAGKVLFAAFPRFARIFVGFGRGMTRNRHEHWRPKGKTPRRHVGRS